MLHDFPHFPLYLCLPRFITNYPFVYNGNSEDDTITITKPSLGRHTFAGWLLQLSMRKRPSPPQFQGPALSRQSRGIARQLGTNAAASSSQAPGPFPPSSFPPPERHMLCSYGTAVRTCRWLCQFARPRVRKSFSSDHSVDSRDFCSIVARYSLSSIVEQNILLWRVSNNQTFPKVTIGLLLLSDGR
jgi:hypothetical protein